MVSNRAANRRAEHVANIAAAARETATPWRLYWRTACWLMSELAELYKRDPRQAQKACTDLAEQTRQFAEALNKQAGGGQ
ncbi:hypothetical protein SAMN05421874_128138 [Nonomuraea maritima]|uniref:Uncharacterized protein n=1 Tax=Nonomuraea maritima TaxID=683260 RepID=A0A1G9MQ84_9ACTN|nr:hypothetical protein [Nonomuraea maritima]SDL76428.1 hypothetical protein SAMN05421874_128138 [Nonomuraea maritima]